MSTVVSSARIAAPNVRPRAITVLLAAAAGHALAAALILTHLVPEMGSVVASSPAPGHAAALQDGLTRFLYAVVLLPPMVAVGVALVLWYSVRPQARTAEFRFWMSLAFAPFVVEELGRAAVVLASAHAAVMGDVITQATSFTTGPAVIFALFGATLGATSAYWAGVLSFAAALAVYCWGRAISAAQHYSASPSVVRRQRRSTGFDMGLAMAAAATVYLMAALVDFLTVPMIAPLFLSTFG